jgi:dTDP-4-amino-4,6-dideoxygalactose transaminase
MKIPFNRPYVAGKEIEFISDAISKRKFSGNYHYTQKCHEFFQEQYNFNKVLLTTSCTDALEMASLILNIESGDEVILPSYTFVSTANAFALRGAKLVFVDSEENNPNIDAHKIEEFITNKTKAIVIVHYAGVACDMGKIIELATKYNLFIVEDAAQAIDSYYKDKPLGGIGDLGTFSFHETKNITCGEGGLITLNKKEYEDKAEIFWEKGTNRSAFFRGEVDKYAPCTNHSYQDDDEIDWQ